MENGETIEQAAIRETAEEACARVRNLSIYTLIDVPHISQVHVFFRAELADLDFAAGPESLEVQLFDEIRNHPDIGRDHDAVQGDQRTKRADHFDQARWQADLFLGFAQGGKNQVGVFGVASTTRESDFATMGRQPAGAQGQYQFRLVTASNRHQDGGLGETSVSLQRARCVVTYPMQ